MPSHLALITLFDAKTGETLCVMDGTHITAARTAGSAVLSCDVLARADARVATIVGAGVQAREHLRLLPLVRDFEQIQICSLHLEDAEQLAAESPLAQATDDIETAVRTSDVVCLATHSAEPVIRAQWVRAGTHVSSVGYCPPRGELPAKLARAHSLFVETLDAFAPVPVGCAELADVSPSGAKTLGAVLTGQAPGRTDARQVTVYKAMGIAMEDHAAATLVYGRAVSAGVGGKMRW